MFRHNAFLHSLNVIVLSGVGGFLLSLTGISIGWMIGALLAATILSLRYGKQQDESPVPHIGIPKYWMAVGQCMLGIELGRKMNSTFFFTFQDHWLTISTMLLLSIVFALLSGLILWKFTKLDLLTSFFAAAPGGLSTIPGIAEELGANTGVVSIAQTMRIFLVVLTIPVILSFSMGPPVEAVPELSASVSPPFQMGHIWGTALLVGIAWFGYFFGRFVKFPAPWLLGSMVSVALLQMVSTIFLNAELQAWWPSGMIVISQVLIGTSIGSRIHRSMFQGLKKIVFFSMVSTIFLIFTMFLSAYLASLLTDLPFITTALAFSPGGISEMTTTSIVLGGDSTFVLAVQVLRVIAVCVILPPLFKLIQYWEMKKNAHEHQSA
ncbi:AbrB family transcriptional regulator [Sporosarcina sp. HYO08]|uniref:AbrB family transcriptional regulator n=1 Tax=Sporosarcina sp. HYO08 TaxID=1759557 RepID=UPI00079AE798|nr:AbrB family transcriptional regulator [Sporosarcina sp. HYO08]KXH81683.1 hypothetical protein AU377_05275 [Sporosarcina sp. HYO08]